MDAVETTAVEMAGIQDLLNRLQQLSKVPSRITKAVATRLDYELKMQFIRGVNAYGNAWKALLPQTVKRKGGDARILRRTDTLSSAVGAKAASGSGIEFTLPDPAEKHQSGTRNMVARKLMPDGKALPPRWSDIIREEMRRAFDEASK